jgi:alpha-galactosidase
MNAQPKGFLTLNGTQTTLLLEFGDHKAPIWRYWGERLPDGAVPHCWLDSERAVPSFSLDTNVPLTIFPTFGVGWYGAPALLAHREGQAFAQDFTRCDIVWVRPGEAVVLSLYDDIAQIKIEISLDLDPNSDTLTCKTGLTNLGDLPLDVHWLAAACLIIPDDAKTIRSYNYEFDLQIDDLSHTTWLRENRRGLTSHDCVPGAVICAAETTPHTGPAYGAQLAWSGNHAARVDRHQDGSYYWQLGEWLAPGEVRLQQGESLTSPEVLATFSPHGLNGIAQNFHAAIRARMTWPSGAMKPRPVHLNTWEGVYFGLDQSHLMEMASGAAELGVERFVLDDGWFHARRNDQAGLGDWWVDPDVFPEGLIPLANHVVGLGMEFGLWVEPEMVNPDSNLFRAHPDWALQLAGRPLLTARNQLVLDLANPAAFDYLFKQIGALLDELPISYLKWDHNRDLTTAGRSGLPAYRGQILAAYRLFDAIRQRWPDVEIEACAGGGGRIDAGIIQHTHRFWTSDCIDAVSRVSIQSGFLQFFPPEIMGNHIGTSPAHSTGRAQSLDFRGGVAIGGHFGIELDPRHLRLSEKTTVKSWVKLYKSLREAFHGSQTWQGEAGDGLHWQAQGSATDCIVSAFRTKPNPDRYAPKIALPFVDRTLAYRVTWLTPSHLSHAHDSAFHKALATAPTTISGAWLAQSGLALPIMLGEDALILRLTATS